MTFRLALFSGFCVFLLAIFMISTSIVSSSVAEAAMSDIEIDKMSQKCITCHTDESMAPKMIEQYMSSAHAESGIGCYDCHSAKAGDFDAVEMPDGTVVGKYPTPKTCSSCHEDAVEENTKSKHAYPFWLYAPVDRSVFEPIIGTKQGCETCHNISALWPDGSVGDCGACHNQHSFDIDVARNPYTCGSCHMGPDHPNIEIYIESKHGNVFTAKKEKWDLSYNSSDIDTIPIEAPVCTTCHMDAVPGVDATHNVSARLAWESQAPWSYRTVWYEEELGSWLEKNEQMKSVCRNCHTPGFTDLHFLTYDLVNLQYNEIRRESLKWINIYTEAGLIKELVDERGGKKITGSNKVLNASWYTFASSMMYDIWHDQGRRFRQGSAMGGADYVQWHGIWDMQHALMEMIEWGAEHNVPEALELYNSSSSLKFFPYKIYDIPGSIHGIVTQEQSAVPLVYQLVPNYWEDVRANVEQAYKKGLISEGAWELWEERYQNIDYYTGKQFGEHPMFEEYRKHMVKELDLSNPKSAIRQAIDVDLPSKAPYEHSK